MVATSQPEVLAQQCLNCYGFSEPEATQCQFCGNTGLEPVTDDDED